MDKKAAEVIAAAINNTAVAMANMAAATALQAETNAYLAGKMDALQRTIQAQQAKVDRNLAPLIERSKAEATRQLEEATRVTTTK